MKALFGFSMAILLAVSVNCKKKDEAGPPAASGPARPVARAGGGEAKVMELCKKKGELHEGFVKILEDNVKDPKQGYLKAAEYVGKTAPEMAKIGSEVVQLISAGKPKSAVWFKACAAEVNAKSKELAERVRPASQKYPADVGDLRELSQSLLKPFTDSLAAVKDL